MTPALLFLLILFMGGFFYTLLSGRYLAAVIEILFFFVNVLCLEYVYTKNLCSGDMDIWREETRLGDIKGNLYQADAGASAFFSYVLLFYSLEFVSGGVKIPVWIFAVGGLISICYMIPIIWKVRSWKEKLTGIFKILFFGSAASIGCMMMLYIMTT